ncbi:MAG: isoprenylcysteine carboxylmethyltransferase family protein, partial [bacterium]
MNTRPGQAKGIGRWVARELSGTAMAGAVLVATSGRWDWTTAWVLVGVYAVTLAVQAAVLIPRSPELLVERATRMRRGTKPWDRLLLSLYGLASLAVLVVAGLDARLGWAEGLHPGLQLAGLLLSLLGNGLVTWAMAANAFFAFSVRLQPERGQSVATGGPYRAVRHPGYAGAAVFALGSALLLGSAWALLPAGVAVILLVVRTSLEDRTLKAELTGYSDYTR